MSLNNFPQPQKTKIVATISDNKCDHDFIRGLIERGVNVFRINTAHQVPETTRVLVDNIRKVSNVVGILIDTKGPEIRTLSDMDPLEVEEDQLVSFSDKPEKGLHVAVSYSGFVEQVPVGSQILIDDGEVSFLVVKRDGDKLICRTENSGTIKKNKSINTPGVNLDLPSLTEKDKAYIKFSQDFQIEFLAHSFVRNARDILDIKELMDPQDHRVKIIAKIENREGLNNIDEIIEEADGIMIARGDLGIEIPAEEVPTIQKRLIQLCINKAKPVITATQMLHSMIDNPRPTRAEVSDVANAVHDGTDALMLSGETAYGEYPFEAVETMSRVAQAAENTRLPRDLGGVKGNSVRTFLAKTAIVATDHLPLKAIIVHTYTGTTARIVSSFRGTTPVYVTCHDLRVARELSLSYGLYPRIIELPDSTDQLVAKSMESLVKADLVKLEDLVLVMAGSPPLRSNQSNLLEINTVANCLNMNR